MDIKRTSPCDRSGLRCRPKRLSQQVKQTSPAEAWFQDVHPTGHVRTLRRAQSGDSCYPLHFAPVLINLGVESAHGQPSIINHKGLDILQTLFFAPNPRTTRGSAYLCCGWPPAETPEIGHFLGQGCLCSPFGLRVGAVLSPAKSTTYARLFIINQGDRSGIKRRHHLPLRQPIGRQRIALEPQQAHAPGLLPGQNALDDGGLQQGQAAGSASDPTPTARCAEPRVPPRSAA